ncbi:hypothetical protein [Streptomyces sp. NPDC020298]|uniref:hypothetical protein n=1 Tax=unclassified Streptomyces TaxID=2593676 RepID=UPI0033C67694
MEEGSLFGLLPPREGGDNVWAGSVPDCPADHFGYKEHLVFGKLFRDPPRRLGGESEELSGFLRGGATLFVGHDPAVEEDAEVVTSDP